MSAVLKSNASASADAVNLSEGVARNVAAVAVFDVASMKHGWLGSAGITEGLAVSGSPNNNTASSTTPLYYTVPTGKVARIRKFTGAIYDNAVGSMVTLGGRSVADTGGLKLEVVNADASIAQTLVSDGNLNFKWLAHAANTPGALVVTASDTTLSVSWLFASPLVLTAGQKLRITPMSSVAYQVGAWGIEYTEETA